MHYSYSKLIKARYLTISDLNAKIKRAEKTGEAVPHLRRERAELEDDLARYARQQSVCGDPIILIR